MPVSVKNEEKMISWIKRLIAEELTLLDQALAEVCVSQVVSVECVFRKQVGTYPNFVIRSLVPKNAF